jgi:bifunctional non-homologous end joining protein LigD
MKGDAVIDGELVAIGQDGVSRFQLLQNALRHEAKLL